MVAVVEALPAYGGVAADWWLYLAAYLVIGYDILPQGRPGHHQGSGVRRELPDGRGHRGRHCLAVYERAATMLEAVAVMLFYQIGELFQSYAVGKSRRNIIAR